MKRFILLAIAVLMTYSSFAQKVSIKKDTIFNGKMPYALLKKGKVESSAYLVCTLHNKPIIELHDSKMEIKGRQAYVMTFLQDQKQCMIIKDKHFPVSMAREIIHYHIADHGTVNELAETRFIRSHPLPAGYTDVAKIVNY